MNRTASTNPLIEISITLIIPFVILTRLSAPEYLGAAGALVVALAFPLSWGVRELVRSRKFSLFAVLGTINLLLTGGIGLLELDPRWFAAKEAAIPGVLGLAVTASALTRYPLVRVLLYSPAFLQVDRIQAALAARGNEAAFERCLRAATLMLGGSFFFSSAMNFLLAAWVVTSPASTTAFNEELARFTLLSYPVILVPVLLIVTVVVLYLGRSMHRLAGIDLREAIRS